MRLKTLLEKLEYTVVRGNDDIEISEVVYDSRKLSKDCLFVCIIGANFDAHSAVGEAVSAHAACVIVSKDVDVPDDSDMTVIKVDDTC